MFYKNYSGDYNPYGYSYDKYARDTPRRASRPRPKLLSVGSYEDLLNKAESKPEYLALMMMVFRRWKGVDESFTVTKEEAVTFLNSVITDHGNCKYLVEDCNDIVSSNYLTEYDTTVTTTPEPVEAEFPPKPFWPPDAETVAAQQNIYEQMARHFEELNRQHQAREMGFMPIDFPMVPAVQQPTTPGPEPEGQYQEGDLVEYGWYDAELEGRIANNMAQHGLSRAEAIIRVFNNPPHDNL